MAQLQSMDARLDTLNDKLCQVNTHVSHIARWQARLVGFVKSPFPSLEAFENQDDDGDSDDDDDDEDDDVCYSPIFSCIVSFLSYSHASYYLYAIFYFCFTLRCHDEFCLSCQRLFCHELSSCKVFKSLP